jgi:hypothetical protein
MRGGAVVGYGGSGTSPDLELGEVESGAGARAGHSFHHQVRRSGSSAGSDLDVRRRAAAPEYFELIPIDRRRLAWGLLVASAVGVLPAATVLDFAALIVAASAWGAVVAVVALVATAAGLVPLIGILVPEPLPERRGGDPLDLGDDPHTTNAYMVHGVLVLGERR